MEARKDARRVVLDYLDEQKRFKAAEERFERFKSGFKEDIRFFMARKQKSSFVFKDEKGNKYSVTDVRPSKVVFDADKLKAKLPRALYDKVVQKKCTVNDWDGFVSYMKKVGADSKLVLSFFDVERVVDKEAVESLVESGEMNVDMLQGCYEVKVSEGYIRVTEMET